MKTYFAYRSIEQDKPIFVSGELKERTSLLDEFSEGIVIAPFNKKVVFELTKIQEISISEFKFNIGKNLPIETSKDEYLKGFNELHKKLIEGKLDKVVLSRVKKVPNTKSFETLFNNLNQEYANTFNYILSSPELGCWLGASPELLCQIENKKIKTVSLAGTKMQNESWTRKERKEQEYVTDYIVDQLKKINCKNIQSSNPFDQVAGPVVHLKSEISAELAIDSNWREVLDSLHPTPAVCGLPTKTAKQLINKVELHDRQLYTGFIGILDEEKKFYVNLRCMQLSNNNAYLYLGGGLTIDSIAEKEWEETERKAKTIENILS